MKERGLDSFVDILAGNAGFIIGYNVLLRLFAGGWIALSISWLEMLRFW